MAGRAADRPLPRHRRVCRDELYDRRVRGPANNHQPSAEDLHRRLYHPRHGAARGADWGCDGCAQGEVRHQAEEEDAGQSAGA